MDFFRQKSQCPVTTVLEGPTVSGSLFFQYQKQPSSYVTQADDKSQSLEREEGGGGGVG